MKDCERGNRRRPFLRSIRARVALAMLAPLAVALVGAGWASISSVSRTVEEGEHTRIANAGRLLRENSLTMVTAPPRPGFLRQVASALGGELVVLDRSRDELRTTFDGEEAAAFSAWVREGGPGENTRPGEPMPVSVGGAPYLVLVERVGEQEICLVYPGHPVADAVRRARRPLILAGAVALVIAMGLAVVLASLITRPLKRLAAEAAEVANGDLDHAVSVTSRDETGELAESFNRMLEGLREYRSNLVRAERLAILGRLASSVAHELRNPLTAIRMNVQMLPDEDDPERRREDVSHLLEEIDRLERVVDEMLALARPAPLEIGDVSPVALVETTVATLRRQLDHLKVIVTIDAPDEGVPRLRADEAKLRQVIVNLLLNAAQAMPEGGPVCLEVRPEAAGIRFSVSDQGGGVDADLAATIFEPFVSGRHGGTGLGLAVSRQIVDAHGGRIDFRTTDEGTTFDVVVPAEGPDRRIERTDSTTDSSAR